LKKKNRSKMYLVGCVRMMTKEGEMDRERERERVYLLLCFLTTQRRHSFSV